MKHAAPRAPRRPRPTRRLMLAALALLAAVLILMGGQGTFAFWTDEASVSTGSFNAGKLDLIVDGQQGKPTAYVKTDLKMDAMLPGESVARIITVANVGDAPLTWVPLVTKSGNGTLGPALTVEMSLSTSGTPTNTTAYPRTGTCPAGATVTSGTTSAPLGKNETRQLCVKVTLPTSTGNGFQSATGGVVTIALNASQVIP